MSGWVGNLLEDKVDWDLVTNLLEDGFTFTFLQQMLRQDAVLVHQIVGRADIACVDRGSQVTVERPYAQVEQRFVLSTEIPCNLLRVDANQIGNIAWS